MRFHVWAQRAEAFVRECGHALDKDPESAFRILAASLHVLRSRLTLNEGLHLAAQLPMFVKAIWLDGLEAEHVPDKSLKRREDFIQRVIEQPGVVVPDDFADLEDADASVATVFAVIRRHVSQGEVDDVRAQLPKDLQSLWA